jgi:hypothetical protein
MRMLVQIILAFVIALLLLIAFVVAIATHVIKMLTESESEAAEDPRSETEPVQH